MEITNLIAAMFDQICKSPAFIYILIAVNFLVFVWEALPFLPSRWIPIVAMVAGAALFPCFVARSTVSPEFPHPIAVLICNGLLAGLASFGLHKGLTTWTRSKWGWPPEPPAGVGLWLATALSVSLLLSGCAGTSAQRVLLVSSSTAAATVNAAYDLWGADALAKVKLAHPEATAEQRVNLLLAEPKNADVVQLYDDWRSANLLWSAVNQTAASGTNAAAVLEANNLRTQLANVGNKLLRLVSELTGQPQPVLTP